MEGLEAQLAGPLNRLEHHLGRLTDVRSRQHALSPIDLEDLTVWNLYVSLEAAVELVMGLVKQRTGRSETSERAFSFLADSGWLSPAQATRLAIAVGFRSRAFVDPLELDRNELHRIATQGVADLDELARALRALIPQPGVPRPAD